MADDIGTITLPELEVTPDNQPAPKPDTGPDVVALAFGGGDFTGMPKMIAPLNQLSTDRIAGHAGISNAAAALAPTDAPMPDVQPLGQVPDWMRYQYSQALQNGETDGPQHFAEVATGIAWSLADDQLDPAQMTNAASALAGALPSHEDLIDYGASIANDMYGEPAPGAVALVKSNLLDAWAQTGTPIEELVQQANVDPDFKAALALPQPAPVTSSPQFPTPEQIVMPKDYTTPMAAEKMKLGGGQQTPAERAVDWAYGAAGGEIAEHALKAAGYAGEGEGEKALTEAGAASYGAAQMMAAGMIGADAAPLIAAAQKAGVKASADALASEMGAVPNPFKSLFPTLKSDEAEGMKVLIRKNTGIARADKDIALDLLEGFRKDVNPLLPEDRQFADDIATFAQDYTGAKERWVADGNDPAKFVHDGAVPKLSTLQVLRDHIEQRPGGGRLPANSPMFPLAETLAGMNKSLWAEIERHFDVESYVQDYYRHSWTDQSAFDRAFGSGRRGTAESLRERSIPYTFNGLLRGLKMKFPDPIDNALRDIQGKLDFLAGERILRTGEETGQIYWSRSPLQEGDVRLNGLQRKPAHVEPPLGEAPAAKPLQIEDDTGRAIPMANRIEGPQAQGQLPGSNLPAPAGGSSVAPRPGETPQGQAQITGPGAPEKPKTGYTLREGADVEYAFAHPSVATIYNNWSGAGFNGWARGGPIYKKLQFAANASTALKLGLSGAHMFNIAHEVVASGLTNAFGEISRGEIGAGLRDMGMALTLLPRLGADLMAGRNFQNIYLGKVADLTPVQQSLRKLYIEAGGRPMGRGQEYFVGETKNLFTAWKQGGIPEMLRSDLRYITGADTGSSTAARVAMTIPRTVAWGTDVLGRVANTLSAPLFDYAIPKLKVAAWANEMAAHIRSHPLATDEELGAVARRNMDSMDDRFGELNQENIFWSRSVKQIANLTLLSTGWWYGTLRAYGRGLADLVTLQNTTRSRWLMALPITTGVLATAYQMFKTGQGPSNWKDFITPKTGGTLASGQEERAKFLSPWKEWMDLYSGVFSASHAADPGKGLFNAATGYVGAKGNPLVRAMTDFWFAPSTQAWRGQLLRDVAPILSENPTKAGSKITGFENWMGFSQAPRSMADPEALGSVLDKQTTRQQREEQGRAYRQDQLLENPAGVEKPGSATSRIPNDMPPRVTPYRRKHR